MDGERFDRLVASLTQPGSRRSTLKTLGGAVLGAIGLGVLAGEETAGKGKGKGKAHGKNKRRKGNARSQALPASCCGGGTCTAGAGTSQPKCCAENANLAGANFKRSNLGGANFRGANLVNADFSYANLSKACLVDADITGARFASANLSGAVYCRTRTGPDSFNNSGCGKANTCCLTCVPLEESRCALGGSCCGGGVCQNNICVCPAGQTNCDGVCRDLQNDADNCGACGDACPAGEICVNGECRCGTNPTCASGLTCCSGECVDLLTDPNNCTRCGNACPASLPNGDVFCGVGLDDNGNEARGCVLLCGDNFRDCNNDYRDGCEVEIRNNNFNCGTCSPTDCVASGNVCKGCRCVPPDGFSTTCQPVGLGKIIRRR